MDSKEKKKYYDYNKKINCIYRDLINCIKNRNGNIWKVINDYIATVSSQNSLLNDLYYKDGIRLGFKLSNELKPKFKHMNK